MKNKLSENVSNMDDTLMKEGNNEGKEIQLLLSTKVKLQKGLFTEISSSLKLQYNRIVILLQYHKLKRKNNKWIGGLENKAAHCQYKECDIFRQTSSLVGSMMTG